MPENTEKRLRDVEHSITSIESHLDQQDGKLDKILGKFEDNGRPGISTRLDRLERWSGGQVKFLWILVGLVAALVVNALWKATTGH